MDHLRPHSGFTLTESLMGVAILAMSITAITMPFTAGAQNELADARRTLATSLAQEMIEEILAKPFNDPEGTSDVGPEADETGRGEFDNVDDYHGYIETAGNITGLDGQAIDDPVAAGLSRGITATYVYVSGQSDGEVASFILITVDVDYHDATVVSLSRLVYEKPGPQM